MKQANFVFKICGEVNNILSANWRKWKGGDHKNEMFINGSKFENANNCGSGFSCISSLDLGNKTIHQINSCSAISKM